MVSVGERKMARFRVETGRKSLATRGEQVGVVEILGDSAKAQEPGENRGERRRKERVSMVSHTLDLRV